MSLDITKREGTHRQEWEAHNHRGLVGSVPFDPCWLRRADNNSSALLIGCG